VAMSLPHLLGCFKVTRLKPLNQKQPFDLVIKLKCYGYMVKKFEMLLLNNGWENKVWNVMVKKFEMLLLKSWFFFN